MTESEMWDYLIENLVATEEELRLVTDVAGYTTETLELVLYSREGYDNFETHREDMEG